MKVPLSRINAHLDVVLRASGSGLRHFSLASTIQNMQTAMLCVVQQETAPFVIQRNELCNELNRAHIIIRNALALMTSEQKVKWGDLNSRCGVDGEGITRANERDALLARAGGEA